MKIQHRKPAHFKDSNDQSQKRINACKSQQTFMIDPHIP